MQAEVSQLRAELGLERREREREAGQRASRAAPQISGLCGRGKSGPPQRAGGRHTIQLNTDRNRGNNAGGFASQREEKRKRRGGKEKIENVNVPSEEG